MNNAAKMIADALTGRDFTTVVVAGKAYTVKAPTIRRIAGAAAHLSCMGDEKTFADLIQSMSQLNEVAKALSWFIEGDESIWEELEHGTLDEVTVALSECFSLVSVKGFTKLLDLTRNVANLTAKLK